MGDPRSSEEMPAAEIKSQQGVAKINTVNDLIPLSDLYYCGSAQMHVCMSPKGEGWFDLRSTKGGSPLAALV